MRGENRELRTPVLSLEGLLRRRSSADIAIERQRIFVDVMDDAEYSSDGLFEYEPGVWYNIAISADVSARTYDVEVGRCGEKRGTVIRGARFRSAANVCCEYRNIWSGGLTTSR